MNDDIAFFPFYLRVMESKEIIKTTTISPLSLSECLLLENIAPDQIFFSFLQQSSVALTTLSSPEQTLLWALSNS
jgi:hypothetical protein